MFKLLKDKSKGEIERSIANPSRITEELVLYYTDCRNLSEVQVVALRDRNLHSGFDVLNQCTSLQIAYLQNNNLTTDLHHLGRMTNLVKLNLSFNSI